MSLGCSTLLFSSNVLHAYLLSPVHYRVDIWDHPVSEELGTVGIDHSCLLHHIDGTRLPLVPRVFYLGTTIENPDNAVIKTLHTSDVRRLATDEYVGSDFR